MASANSIHGKFTSCLLRPNRWNSMPESLSSSQTVDEDKKLQITKSIWSSFCHFLCNNICHQSKTSVQVCSCTASQPFLISIIVKRTGLMILTYIIPSVQNISSIILYVHCMNIIVRCIPSRGHNLIKKQLPSDTKRIQSAPIYWQYFWKCRKFG